MGKRSPHGQQTTRAFSLSLDRAASEDGHPQPLCQGRPGEYVDYEAVPSEAEAAALCAECPLLVECLANARRTKPAWGVWGGIAWIDGRQAHLSGLTEAQGMCNLGFVEPEGEANDTEVVWQEAERVPLGEMSGTRPS